MNEKQTIPGEKSTKIPPFYAGGFIIQGIPPYKAWAGVEYGLRHNINPIIDDSGNFF